MIIVIADNLTCAAEIAGLGRSYGLDTVLLSEVPTVLPQRPLVVIATDTRSGSEQQAIADTEALCRKLGPAMSTAHQRLVLYKAVDPYMRGHLVGELQAMMRGTAYQQVVCLPANPSHDLIIRGGCCYVEGTPLDQTPYAAQSDTVIDTASVCLRLGITPQSRIRVPDAVTPDDVRQVVQQSMQSNNLTLLAGSFDLFAALLEYKGYARAEQPDFEGLSRESSALIVCGSPQSTDISSRPFVRKRDLPLDSMPRDVFDGSQGAAYWLANIQLRHFSRAAIQPARYGLVLNIPYERSCSRQSALRLRTEMAQVVSQLVEQMQPAELVIEGGATAYAIFERQGWRHFVVDSMISDGVVRLHLESLPSMQITFKPGHYPWGDTLFGWPSY